MIFNAASNLFVADQYLGIASGFSYPQGLAFDSLGDLFVAEYGLGDITEITPGGARSVFASGLGIPQQMAFDGAGNLFVTSQTLNSIIEITSSGVQSVFASGLNQPYGLVFVPEPSTPAILDRKST